MSDTSNPTGRAFPLPHILRPGEVVETQAVVEGSAILVTRERLIVVEGDKALMKQRPATSLALQPLYKDHFGVQGTVVWFTRDRTGKVNGMHVGASRMRDMPFARVK